MDPAMEEARKAMIAKRFGGNTKGARTGGEGTARRKAKGSMKTMGDDKKLSGVLKKMQLTPINGVEEVNIFKDDGDVIQIPGPKIQASVPSNTFVVSGISQTKKLESLLPNILSQLGPESMDYLRAYAATMGAAGPAAGSTNPTSIPEEDEDEDDEVPDLVENFEEAAEK